MPTVIDELVLELGLDATKFTNSQRQALAALRQFEGQATTSARGVEIAGKRIGEVFTAFKREAIGLFATFVGGYSLKEFLENTTRLDANMARLSRVTGISASELAAWGGAATAAGGTMEGMAATIGGLNQQLQMFRINPTMSDLPVKLRGIDVAITDSAGHVKTATQLILDVFDAFDTRYAHADAGQKAAYMKYLGFDDATIAIYLRNQGHASQSLREFEQRIVQLQKVTPRATQLSEQFQISLSYLRASLIGAGNALSERVLPYLNPFIDWMTGVIDRSPGLTAAVGSIGAALTAVFALPAMRFLFGGGLASLFSKTVIRGGGGLLGLGLGVMEMMKNDKDHSIRSAIRGFLASAGIMEPETEEDKKEASPFEKGPTPSLRQIFSGQTPRDPWSRFLEGIGYLETSFTGAPNPNSSARGFFQFMPTTAQDAINAGIGDPRVGSYAEQQAKTMAFIRRFHPAAAKALDQGDFFTAIRLLKEIWPSLPGGSQQQGGARERNFNRILTGERPTGGPHRPGPIPFENFSHLPSGVPVGAPAAAGAAASHNEQHTSMSNSVTVGTVVVNTKATDATGIARDIRGELAQAYTASQGNGALV